MRSSVGGTPLAGVTVTLLASPFSTTTGVNGAYSIPGVPVGSYVAEAALFGFGSNSATVDIAPNQNTPRDFSLRPSVFADNAESNQGWSLGISGDNAVAGIWVRADPQGTGGGAVQPEDDHSPAPGVTCFVTGNCPGGIPGCGTGDNDVDSGRTTLMSPVINLQGQTGATSSTTVGTRTTPEPTRGKTSFRSMSQATTARAGWRSSR
ncbi:MAG: carboxypeptidase-like regulatory domain-containing protein [Candidatus Eisenbacteria bacterium]